MAQMPIPNIKQKVEPGQFNTMQTLGLFNSVPKGIYSLHNKFQPLEKRTALNEQNSTTCHFPPIWTKPLVLNTGVVG